jgi:cation:H+ antiporter
MFKLIAIPKKALRLFSASPALARGASSSLWTFPTVLASAIIIAWAAEAAQFLVSQGLALAVLAWLQTLPEFAVEAVISWQAGQTARYATDPNLVKHATSLVSANFTGSLRLLVGLGWPMIYTTAAFVHKKRSGNRLRELHLEPEHAVEVVFLLICIAYFFIVWIKGNLTLLDTVILTVIYLAYLYFLKKIPPQSDEKIEDAGTIPKLILSRKPPLRNGLILGLFLLGGVMLYFAAPAFLDSLEALAAGLGLSTFVFVQWVAPFLSEFPEKVSAFNWARRVSTAPMALMNMVSSNINQCTMLVAMLPIAYGISLGRVAAISFDEHQRLEILLTLGQLLLGALLLANMRFSWWEATLLFTLWLIQFVTSGFEMQLYPVPATSNLAAAVARWLSVEASAVESVAHRTKEVITVIYFLWSAWLIGSAALRRRGFEAFSAFPKLMREHW